MQEVYEELLATCTSMQDSQEKLEQEKETLEQTIKADTRMPMIAAGDIAWRDIRIDVDIRPLTNAPLCSVLFRHGIDYIRVLEREMREWLEDHEYESVEQIKGIMSQNNCPDPTAFERAQYTRALKSYPRSQPSTTPS